MPGIDPVRADPDVDGRAMNVGRRAPDDIGHRGKLLQDLLPDDVRPQQGMPQAIMPRVAQLDPPERQLAAHPPDFNRVGMGVRLVQQQVFVGQREALDQAAAHRRGQGLEHFGPGYFFAEMEPRFALLGIQVQLGQGGEREKAVDQIPPRRVGHRLGHQVALQMKYLIVTRHPGLECP